MLLDKNRSCCGINQKIIVSKDDGTPREHRAVNPDGKYEVYQFKLDGDLVKNESCCDFLLLNDSLKRAYLIELKGRNISDAVPQLENGERLCRAELCGYEVLYRIVASKVRTHEIQKNGFRKFADKCGGALKYRSCTVFEEEL